MINVAVLGANGQLGQNLKAFIQFQKEEAIQWDFYSSTEIDITKPKDISALFLKNKNYDYLLNFAAYTAVDQAEKERELAYAVNAQALQYLTECCSINNVILIHLSTDYVFSGKNQEPYTENDPTQPVNYYGLSKLQGEEIIQKHYNRYFILRSGWIYSHFGNNFYNTIKRLAKSHDEIRVVNDQIGTPTRALTVIDTIYHLITSQATAFGTYHIGNRGSASWFEFAKAILTDFSYSGKLHPIPTHDYPTPAKRPEYSVLAKDKFEKTFTYKFPSWEYSFQKHSQNSPAL